MKTIKVFTIFLFATLFVNCAFAQVYSDEILFYKKENGSDVRAIKVDYSNDRVFMRAPSSSGSYSATLKKDPSYYEKNENWKNLSAYTYDTELSNSNYDVYKRYEKAGSGYTCDWDNGGTLIPTSWPSAYHYIAFSKDLSVVIIWDEYTKDNSIHNRTYWYKISKEDLLPKPANHDFLED